MNICSSINHYYQQTVESNVVKKSTEITASVAYYAFNGLKGIIQVPGLIFAISLSAISCSIMLVPLGFDFISSKICGLETLDQVPTNLLQQIVITINTVALYAFSIAALIFFTVGLFPFFVVAIGTECIISGLDYISDIAIQISQIAIDKLGIPVQLSMSRRQLISILNEWKRNALPGEDREKACKKILNFYDKSMNLIYHIMSTPQHLDLADCLLQDLPNIFHYKPFSMGSLSLNDSSRSY